MTEIKKYKYWFFYIKPKYLDDVITEDDDSLLYAYTDNEEYADLFISQRDMKKFFIKIRKIQKDEVNFLADKFNREYILKKDIWTNSNGIGSQIINYPLVLTKTENNLLQSHITKITAINMWKYVSVDPKIFNEKYFKILKDIEYVEKHIEIYTWKRDNPVPLSVLHPDQLSIFVNLFSHLLSLKKESNL